MSPAAPPQDAWHAEIMDAWRPLFVAALPTLVGLVALGLVLHTAWTRIEPRLSPRASRVVQNASVLFVVAIGLGFALSKASLFDDAFISFRYARNFLDGHGLVWNVGERVEGYTNFLWVVLVALVSVVSRIEIPMVGFVLAVLAFALNLVVIARLSFVLARAARPEVVAFPFAALLLAMQDTFHTYGTTGLETGFASLLVNLGALALVTSTRARGSFLAGLALIASVLTRPDHSLFYVVGALVVFVVNVAPVARVLREGPRAMWRAGVDAMVAYAAPFTIYLAYLAWKVSYYGSIVPNTYYAKSAHLSYWEQGAVFTRAFVMQSHIGVVVVVALVVAPFAWRASDATRRFVLFAIPASVAYVVYVWKVGGDFMHGRFYVSVLPLVVVLACLAPDVLPSPARFPRRAIGIVLASMCFVLGGALDMFRDAKGHWLIRWHITEERHVYRLKSFVPLEVDRFTWPTAARLKNLADKGIRPVIAAPGIGVLGYTSGLELIDTLGLTDATVARQEITRRGRPGHEKWANHAYIAERSPHFIGQDSYTPTEYRALVELTFPNAHRRWRIYRWDRELMRRIREADPELGFVDLEAHLDTYLEHIDEKLSHVVRADYAFFKKLYFDHNADKARQERFETWLAAKR